LAAALGDDANYASTTTTALGNRYTKTETDAKVVELSPPATKSHVDSLGINAGTLDGIDSSSFLRSDVSDTFTGNLRIASPTYGGISIGEAPTNYAGWDTQLNSHGTSHSRINVKTSDVQMGIYAHDSWHHSTPAGYVGTYTNHPLSFVINGNEKMVLDTSGVLKVNNNIVWNAGNSEAFTDSGWVLITTGFQGTWVAYNTSTDWAPGYRIIGNVVHLKGLVKGGSATSLLTLPAAIVPPRSYLMPRPATSTGDNVVTGHPSLYINGANLTTESWNAGWTSLHCSYVLD